MRQLEVIGLDKLGNMTAVSRISDSLRPTGLRPEDVIGQSVFAFAADAEELHKRLRASLDEGDESPFVLANNLNPPEHWEIRVLKCVEPTAAIMVAKEVCPAMPDVSEADIELLRRLADDATLAELGSGSAIRVHLHRLRKRFGVRTLTGLIGAAAKCGLLDRE